MKEKIYQGSSKTLYNSDEDFALIMTFEDKMRTHAKQIIDIAGKGAINNAISAHLMQKLDMIGIDNHFIDKINMQRQLIQYVETYPIQVHVSTIACGRYVKDFGMESGYVFDMPLIDFRIKNCNLDYPPINEHQIVNFGWLSKEELLHLKEIAIKVHNFLVGFFAGLNIRMVDIKLEFGRIFNGEEFIIMLVDEISPDTCRLWDMETNETLCYELADQPEKIITAYRSVLNRLGL